MTAHDAPVLSEWESRGVVTVVDAVGAWSKLSTADRSHRVFEPIRVRSRL